MFASNDIQPSSAYLIPLFFASSRGGVGRFSGTSVGLQSRGGGCADGPGEHSGKESSQVRAPEQQDHRSIETETSHTMTIWDA